MKTKKLKLKLHEIETQNCVASDYCQTDPTYSPSETKKRKKRKKKNIMQLESMKEGVSTKTRSLKSKDKPECSDNSKKSGSIVRKRTRCTDVYDDVEAKFSVMERAERVLSRLEDESPFFLKCMLPSNVSHGFWLHLPKKFCTLHLPNHDTAIVLVDEWGNEYKTSYLLGRHGLSAGWRGFSIAHRLLKGDILIFRLTEPCKLKVHIVRVNEPDVVNAALCLINLDAHARGQDSEDVVKKDNRKRKKTKYVEPFILDMSTPAENENAKAKNAPKSVSDLAADQSACNSERFSSRALEGSEITNRLHPNDICCSKTSFLKDRHCEGIPCT